MIKSSVMGIQEVKKALLDEIAKLEGGNKVVLVGLPEGEGEADSGMTIAQIGAVHEFGADINHPGGTSYGYQTKEDAEDGKVRFLKKGEGFMELGETGPHVISIPARPWLQTGVDEGMAEYLEVMEDGIADGLDKDTILEQVGVMAVGRVQQKIVDVRTPPNAKSTIKKKGSSNPLVDKGVLGQSVSFLLSDKLPEEGIGCCPWIWRATSKANLSALW